MSSARIQRDIQALGKGELDIGTLQGRIKSLLGGSSSAAEDVRRALDEAHRDSAITTDDYNRLTEFITENTGAREAPNETGAVGDTVFVDPGPLEEGAEDPSETRLVDAPGTGSTDAASSGDTDSGGSQRPPDKALAVGTRLRDRFILDEVLGIGGMGTVYKGRDALKLEAQDRNPFVAVKILNDSFSQRPEAFIALQREASRQQRLAHPNIATVYDFDRDRGVMFITMEYLDGRTLDAFIREKVRPNKGIPLDEAMPIIEDLCAALSHAHARNIVHADFKPGNCFLTSSNHVKVLDFGIARAMKDPDSAPGDETLFDPRSIGALTPAYASPEMLTDSAEPDPRDDIYALACVTYELLTGRHPFHRVPADQAKASDLKPEKVRGLSRRQNAALFKALEFERDRRTPSVDEFIQELRQDTSSGALILRVASIAVATILVIGLAVMLPVYFERQQTHAIIEDLTSLDAGRINQGIEDLAGLGSTERQQVLLESRSALIDYFRTTFNSMMSADDDQVPFAEVGRLLSQGLALYPDSAAMTSLNEVFTRRRDAHLATLAAQFEDYLTPERLLPEQGTDDLYDLLNRLRAIDPDNQLLTDERIQAAYAAAVENQLDQEHYDLARSYLDAGMGLVPDDPTLSDLRDRLEVIEQQLARAQTIANLKAELAERSAGIDRMQDVLNLAPIVGQLGELEGDAPEIDQAGSVARTRLADALEAVVASSSLAPLDDFLDRYASIWQALGQPDVPGSVRARRDELAARENALVDSVRDAIGTPAMTVDGDTVAELLDRLRVIDPADPRLEQLTAEIVRERQRRAEVDLAQQDWDGAREELKAGLALPLPAGLMSSLNDGLARVDQLQNQYLADLEEQRRLEALEQEEERRRLEEQRLREEAERQQQRLAARQAEIDDAASSLTAAVAAFPGNDAVEATRDIEARIATLAALQPTHPELTRVREALPGLIERHVRGIDDPDAALAGLAALEEVAGSDPSFVALRSELEQDRRAEREADRQDGIRAAESELQAALASTSALEQTETRRRADQALRELETLASDDAARVSRAREQYVAAFVAAAAPLIEAKRFSLAGELIDSAAEKIPGSDAVAGAQKELASARSAYQQERETQQALARQSALRQRFQLDVSTGELDKAGRSLDELRRMDPGDDFVKTRAPEMLAEAYAKRASAAVDRGEFDAARTAVATGLTYAADSQALMALRRSIDTAELRAGIASWFSGDTDRPATAVAADMQRFRTVSGDGFRAAEAEWEGMAKARLQRLQSDPGAYNALLTDLQTALPDSRVLAGITPLSLRPDLAVQDIFGNWCGPKIKLELSRNNLRFDLGNRKVDYPVTRYQLDDQLILVHWQQERSKEFVFEFGRFSDARDQMTQIRGREANSNQWQTYNRTFNRCL
jgi:serine/threonine protein kinase